MSFWPRNNSFVGFIMIKFAVHLRIRPYNVVSSFHELAFSVGSVELKMVQMSTKCGGKLFAGHLE